MDLYTRPLEVNNYNHYVGPEIFFVCCFCWVLLVVHWWINGGARVVWIFEIPLFESRIVMKGGRQIEAEPPIYHSVTLGWLVSLQGWTLSCHQRFKRSKINPLSRVKYNLRETDLFLANCRVITTLTHWFSAIYRGYAHVTPFINIVFWGQFPPKKHPLKVIDSFCRPGIRPANLALRRPSSSKAKNKKKAHTTGDLDLMYFGDFLEPVNVCPLFWGLVGLNPPNEGPFPPFKTRGPIWVPGLEIWIVTFFSSEQKNKSFLSFVGPLVGRGKFVEGRRSWFF